MNHLELIQKELIRLTPYFYFIYLAVLGSILINTIYVYVHSKEKNRVRSIIIFGENILLSLAMIAGCAIGVFMIDTSKKFYDTFNITNNRLLSISLISTSLCLINIITIIYYKIVNKNKS